MLCGGKSHGLPHDPKRAPAPSPQQRLQPAFPSQLRPARYLIRMVSLLSLPFFAKPSHLCFRPPDSYIGRSAPNSRSNATCCWLRFTGCSAWSGMPHISTGCEKARSGSKYMSVLPQHIAVPPGQVPARASADAGAGKLGNCACGFLDAATYGSDLK